jgi:hypothetical protein
MCEYFIHARCLVLDPSVILIWLLFEEEDVPVLLKIKSLCKVTICVLSAFSFRSCSPTPTLHSTENIQHCDIMFLIHTHTGMPRTQQTRASLSPETISTLFTQPLMTLEARCTSPCRNLVLDRHRQLDLDWIVRVPIPLMPWNPCH